MAVKIIRVSDYSMPLLGNVCSRCGLVFQTALSDCPRCSEDRYESDNEGEENE